MSARTKETQAELNRRRSEEDKAASAQVAAAMPTAQALKYKAAIMERMTGGWTLDQTAGELDLTIQATGVLYRDALREVQVETVGDYRAMQLRKIRFLETECLDIIENADDADVKLKAIAQWTKLLAREAALLGLDNATDINVNVHSESLKEDLDKLLTAVRARNSADAEQLKRRKALVSGPGVEEE